MRIFSIIIIILLVSRVYAEWLPIKKLDYSVSRPLEIESRYINGYRFDIIRPQESNKNITGDHELQMVAEHYQDNLLLIRKETSNSDFPIILSENIELALKERRPVVGLETTIISHGMPFPENVRTALEVEKIIKENGCEPMTIGIVNGKIKCGEIC